MRRSCLVWPFTPAALALVVLGLRRRVAVVTVEGDSMWPALMPGDRLLVRRVPAGRLKVGQVVVGEQPEADGRWPALPARSIGRRQWIIKRIAALPGDPIPVNCWPAAGLPGYLVPAGKLVLLGDNAAWSQDSRQFGCFPSDRLLGVVVRPIPGG